MSHPQIIPRKPSEKTSPKGVGTSPLTKRVLASRMTSNENNKTTDLSPRISGPQKVESIFPQAKQMDFILAYDRPVRHQVFNETEKEQFFEIKGNFNSDEEEPETISPCSINKKIYRSKSVQRLRKITKKSRKATKDDIKDMLYDAFISDYSPFMDGQKLQSLMENHMLRIGIVRRPLKSETGYQKLIKKRKELKKMRSSHSLMKTPPLESRQLRPTTSNNLDKGSSFSRKSMLTKASLNVEISDKYSESEESETSELQGLILDEEVKVIPNYFGNEPQSRNSSENLAFQRRKTFMARSNDNSSQPSPQSNENDKKKFSYSPKRKTVPLQLENILSKKQKEQFQNALKYLNSRFNKKHSV